jgi:hypothetical protein
MKIGDAQGFPTRPNLGRIADSLESYRKAGDIYQRIAAKNSAYLLDLAVPLLLFLYLSLVRRYSRSGAKLGPESTPFRPPGLLVSIDAGKDCITGFDGTGRHAHRVGTRFAALLGLYSSVEFLLLVLSDVLKTFADGRHIVQKILLHLLQLCLNFSILIGANGHACLMDVRHPFFVGAGHGSLQD